MDILQIVLFVALLVMAAIAIASLVWALRLSTQLQRRPTPKHFDVHLEAEKVFSADELAMIGQQAEVELREVAGRSARQLRDALATIVAGLGTKTEEMTSLTISQELEKFQVSLEALREETIKEFNDIQKQLDARRGQLNSELDALVAKDRAERMEGFNARLNDVISSYIVEALDNNIDLGAQSAYILATLEQHKEDIKKDVLA